MHKAGSVGRLQEELRRRGSDMEMTEFKYNNEEDSLMHDGNKTKARMKRDDGIKNNT